eukprot:492989_1
MADSDEKKQNPADIMEYRILGNTGLKVSCLGLGMMTLDSEDQAIELISTVRKYGVNFFDNAELYGRPCGTGEKLFGSALKKLQEKDPKLYRRSELVITTKLFFGCGDGNQPNTKNRKYAPNELGLSRKHLIEGINESLERLQLDYVDIIYAHTVDALTPTEEIVMGFTDIIRNGKAFYWGTSGWPAQKITEAYWIAKINNWIPPVVEQPPYNMFNRTQVEKDLLPMFYAPYKIGTTIWGPLDAGILTGKYVKEVPKDSRLGDGNSLGKWWYVAYLTDIANGYNINKFEVQSYGTNTWLECTAVTVTVTEYQCQATTAFVLPLTVKLTETNGEIIISNDLITEYTDNIIYNFGDNFGKNAVTPLPTNANPSQTSTNNPSKSPTSKPTKRSKRPTNIPTNLPSNNPSLLPLKNPTKTPTNNPTNLPSHNPSLLPSKNPTIRPTDAPIIPGSPTKAPSNPTAKPSSNPACTKTSTNIPTNIPTTKPSSNPSQTRTNIPTNNPLPTVSIAPTETRTTTDTPTGVSTSLNPTNTPTFKCDDTCDSDRDNDKITIKVIFKFQAWIMYDLTHIKCWLYEIFIKWFIHFEFVQYFDVCDIQIIVRGGKRNLGKNCINGPCVWDSKTRRLLQDESIGNVSVSIISNDENILQSTNGLSMVNLSDILSTEITTQFDMNMDTKVEVVQESKDNDKKDNETEIFSSEIQIIIIIILIGLMVFIIGLCIICYRKYKKKKCTKKDMDTTVNMTPTDETKDGSAKTQQTNIVAVENDDNDGQNCMYEL